MDKRLFESGQVDMFRKIFFGALNSKNKDAKKVDIFVSLKQALMEADFTIPEFAKEKRNILQGIDDFIYTHHNFIIFNN